jgi:SAM-dependent methyltransferase
VSETAPDGSPVDLYAQLPERGEGEIVARAVRPGAEILELGCGTGRITAQLRARGFRVVAVDQSEEMLGRVEGAERVRADIETLELGRRFDAVLLASNLVNAERDEQRRSFLEACRRHVAEDGVVVIEGLPPGWRPNEEDSLLGDIVSRVADVVVDGELVRGVAEYERGDERWRHPFTMRVFDEDGVRAALAQAGLELERFLDDRRSWLVARPVEYRLEWRGAFENGAVNELHAEAFGHAFVDDDWLAQVNEHSLGWVCAWSDDGELVGFVNVPWDGALHAFILDTIVSRKAARRGLGTAMVKLATAHARAAGCDWLHVDFDDELRPFYFEACGFEPTNAGLINLKARR